MLKKILIGLGILVVCFIIFAIAYKIIFTQGIIENFEAGNPDSTIKVLIGSQGSEYKEALVKKLTDTLTAKNVYCKVIKISFNHH